jgi:hypothetical protein
MNTPVPSGSLESEFLLSHHRRDHLSESCFAALSNEGQVTHLLEMGLDLGTNRLV